jgi:hypothetical protein
MPTASIARPSHAVIADDVVFRQARTSVSKGTGYILAQIGLLFMLLHSPYNLYPVLLACGLACLLFPTDKYVLSSVADP